MKAPAGPQKIDMANYVAAIDQGTTSTRCIVFDRRGTLVSCAQQEHKQIYPRAGWVEHDPEEIWQRTQQVLAKAIESARLSPADLAAIGIANQRETTIVWNRRTGKAVSNAIVWQDTRVRGAVEELSRNEGQDRYRAKTGLPLATYFSGLKIRWVLDEIAGIRAQAEAGDLICGTIDSFLIWNLSGGPRGGVHLTDVTNASRTQLMNIASLEWDLEILRDFDIPIAILPKILPSSTVYGHAVLPSVRGVPIAAALGDQQAALVGQACFKPGEAKNTYGTGCFLLMNTGQTPIPSKFGLLTTVAYKFGEKPTHYALEGSIAITGALVQWLRDNLGLIESSANIERLAMGVKDNGGVFFVPAFSGLYAPYWQDRARGVIAGLTLYANKGHLARATLEATAFQVRDVVEAMTKDAGLKLDLLRVDGGMVENDLLMQFQADTLGIPVVCPKMRETTALGAAYAAGLAVGFFQNTEEIAAHWSAERRWAPQMEEPSRERLYHFWKKAVRRSFDWVE
jgi:glycerol kinase